MRVPALSRSQAAAAAKQTLIALYKEIIEVDKAQTDAYIGCCELLKVVALSSALCLPRPSLPHWSARSAWYSSKAADRKLHAYEHL